MRCSASTGISCGRSRARRGAVRDRVLRRDRRCADPGLDRAHRRAGLVNAAPDTIWREAGGQLLLMAALFLLVRPAAHFAQLIVANLMLVPGLTNLVRWQNHWHVVRQGWTFFQNDFAGRIAARVMQTGPALRESVVLSIAGIWYILVYGTSAMLLLVDGRLAARRADRRLVRAVPLGAVALSAADARALAGDVGDALGPDRQDRRQLHQYPDRQAVRPRPRRGRVRARRGRRAHRDLARAAAHRDVVGPVPAGDERAA